MKWILLSLLFLTGCSVEPLIKIGDKCTLHGVEFTVIGRTLGYSTLYNGHVEMYISNEATKRLCRELTIRNVTH